METGDMMAKDPLIRNAIKQRTLPGYGYGLCAFGRLSKAVEEGGNRRPVMGEQMRDKCGHVTLSSPAFGSNS